MWTYDEDAWALWKRNAWCQVLIPPKDEDGRVRANTYTNPSMCSDCTQRTLLNSSAQAAASPARHAASSSSTCEGQRHQRHRAHSRLSLIPERLKFRPGAALFPHAPYPHALPLAPHPTPFLAAQASLI